MSAAHFYGVSIPLDLPLLRSLLANHFQVAGQEVGLVPISTGQFNTSFWVDVVGRRFVLRLAPTDDTGLLFYEKRIMRQEPALHALIRQHTSIPLPEVLVFDFSRGHIDRDYLVLEALPGTPLSHAQLSRRAFARALEEVGIHLRALHALTASQHLGQFAYGYLGEHRPLPPQPSWTGAFALMWNALLDDVVACGTYSVVEAEALRKALEHHIHHFERDVEPCLLHMDVWAQNILVDEAGRVTGLIDFDRALWGDVEIEFAVLDYCGISKAPFWNGYGTERDTSHSAQVRQLFYLLYELQKYMPIEVWRGKNIAAAMDYKRQCLELARPLLA